MNIKYSTAKKSGLIAAGFANIIGVQICSKLFSNNVLNEADPVIMSNFGLLMICIWGGAYIATSTIHSNILWLAAVLAVEKLIYFISWVNWLFHNDLWLVYEADFLAGFFYSIYGLNDFAFMLFFMWICVREKSRT